MGVVVGVFVVILVIVCIDDGFVVFFELFDSWFLVVVGMDMIVMIDNFYMVDMLDFILSLSILVFVFMVDLGVGDFVVIGFFGLIVLFVVVGLFVVVVGLLVVWSF